MQIEVLVEGEGLGDVATICLPRGAAGRDLVAAVAAKGGFPAAEASLFAEGDDEEMDISGLVVDERLSGRVHHVHRTKQIKVQVFYTGQDKTKVFRPSARVQQVLDWAVSPQGFNIDPAIAPEMELALHGQTMALPKTAHIGRFVRHPHHTLALDLIRGVVPNGGVR